MKNMSMMRKHIICIAGAMVLACTALSGCKVPEQNANVVNINPDFNVPDSAKLDFTELHNDTMSQFTEENSGPYVFIRGVDIDGDMGKKVIKVRATTVEGAEKEDAEHFASALLARLADAATEQYSAYETSTAKSFGTVFQDFALDLIIQDEAGKELLNLQVPAGENIPLDPDYEAYEEDWERELEIYQENVVYGPDGKVVSE